MPVLASTFLPVFRCLRVCLLISSRLYCHNASGGTWTALAQPAPDNVNTMLLLPDGTVMAADANNWINWYRLTPDIHGSYVNGTWTTLAPMHDSRLYYASDVLTNGRIFVAGGEYGSGAGSAEIYDPLLNSWAMCAGSGSVFVDMISVLLPNGNLLTSPVDPTLYGHSAIYNPNIDSWPLSPALVRGYDQDEASWVMLPDNSILTIDPFGTSSERYIPSLNQWVNDAMVPVPMYNSALSEIGAFFLLANSNALCIGNAGYTALYTPSGSTNPGSWAAGPAEPAGLGAPDAPGAVMVTGNVLCAFGPPGNYNPPTAFYEYNPVLNSFTAMSGPGSFTNNLSPYVTRMLDLPDGTVLFSISGNQLYDYQPAGAPLGAGQPSITSITTNYYRSYHLTGTLLNGISQGAAYGDDAQMNSNYPLVRMTNNSTGNVYYARSYNWSSTGVMTGTTLVTTEFIVPSNLTAGNYSLVVVANGNSSAPVPFTFLPDALQITPFTGFAASGPNGGPVAPQSVNFALTNAGASSINWTLGNTPAWLNVSTNGGSLAPGAASTTVAVSLNTSTAAAEPLGNYAATVWFTNLTTGAVQSAPFSYQSTPLVVNGGFEYGSTAFWTLSGNLGGSTIASDVYYYGQPSYIHSGSYAAILGTNASLGYLSQTIPTFAGQTYTLSFWLDETLGAATNEFIVSWNGTNLLSQTNLGIFPYTNFQFSVMGATGGSVLQFGFRNADHFFGLDDVSVEPAFTYATSGGNITITGYVGPGGALTIPTNINGLTVTGIGNGLVSVFGGASVTSVAIPFTITSIGALAFYDCTSLGSIIFPASITNIGADAFQDCTNLTNIFFDGNPPNVGLAAFGGDPATVYYLPCATGWNSTFAGLPALPWVQAIFTSTTSAESVTITGFSGLCTNGPILIIPSVLNGLPVTGIASNAFRSLTSLTSVTIPGSVTSIGDDAFFGCTNLTNVSLANGLLNIGDSAFRKCNNLTSVIIPASVTNIVEYAFLNCTKLATIYFIGNAPAVGLEGFTGESATAYFLPNTTGWTNFTGDNGIPPVEWNPGIQTGGTNFGVKGNQFGFNITNTANLTVEVLVCTNLANAVWAPLQTATLTNGFFYFSEALQTNNSGRYFGLGLP